MFNLFLFGSALLLISTTSAFAYLDPGTGSFVLQMIVAGVLTVAASIRMFWSHIKDFARRIFRTKTPPLAPPSDPA